MSTRDLDRERYLRFLRTKGLAGYVPAGPVQDRIRSLHDRRGITFNTISERTGLDRETLLMQYRGVNKKGQQIRSAKMVTHRAVMGARFGPADCTFFPALGIRRRLQALQALGYTLPFLVDRLPVGDHRQLHRTSTGRKSRWLVHSGFAQAVITLYDKLYDTDPAEEGVIPQAASRARSYAAQKGYAPPSCWDADTIDDPDAFPEWTGRCGTIFGKRLHGTTGIPLCPACEGVTGEAVLSASKLEAARLRRGWSQNRLAREAGIKGALYRSWEYGRTQPKSQKQLDRVLTALDITFDEVADKKESIR